MDFTTYNASAVAAMFLYLVYRDLVRPLRNGRASKNPGNPHPYASEDDMQRLAQSHREHRAKTEAQYAELVQRLTRVETLLEPHGKDKR